jgi:hypothetical protein
MKLLPKKDKSGPLFSHEAEPVIETMQFVPPYPATGDQNWTNSLDAALRTLAR